MGRIARGISCLAAMLVVAGWAQAQAGDPDMPAARTAAIGFAGPLADSMVRSARFGAQLAIDEANRRPPAAQHGQPPLRFALLPQDDKSNPNLAGYVVARYFVNSKVIGVLGHWNSGPAIAAGPVYDEAGIAQVNITPTSHRIGQQGFHSFFRVLGSTDDTARYLAESATAVLGARRVAVIHNDTPFSITLAEAFTRELSARAVPVLRLDAVSAKTSDFNAPLKAAIGSGADLIFFSAITQQLPPFLDSARRMKVGAKILLTGGAISEQIDDSGQVYALEPNVPLDRCPRQKSFQQRYIARYGTPPTIFSRDAYDAAGMLIQAARQVDSNEPAQVAEALRAIRYQGLGGEIRFDRNGGNANPVYTLYRSAPQAWQPLRVLPAEQNPSACARN